MSLQQEKLTWKIESRSSYFHIDFKELYSYRHLLFRLVRKDFLVNYQQTLLGPIWILFQPLLTMITYVFVFNKVIGVAIGGGMPPVLFYFSSIVLWNLFNDSFASTSRTFRDNIHLFSKVYFPRLIIPFASIVTQLLRFLIQFTFLILILIYFMVFKDFSIRPTVYIFLIPVVAILVGLMSLGMGLILSVITAKYRDLGNFVDIFVRVLLFVTPVIYPMASVKESIRWIVQLNPLSPLFELFRLGVLGQGTVSPIQIVYSISFIIVTLFVAVMVFNKQGSKLIDVI